MLQALFANSTGTGLTEAEGRGVWVIAKESWQMPSAESAIHSMSTVPLLSSLLSFTLTIEMKYRSEGGGKK